MIEILMPFYGDTELAKEAVRSVLAQTSDQWRLLVVDDAYPDPEFAAWLGHLAHPNIRYVRNARNLGVGGNFRRCVELSTADHVVMLGCDDRLLPHYVHTVTQAFDDSPDVALVHPRVCVIDDAGRPTSPLSDRVKRWLMPRGSGARILMGEPLARSLLVGNWMYFPAIAWRRDVLVAHPFRADLDTALDLALLLDLVLEGNRFLLIDIEVFAYRRHRASMSSRTAASSKRFDEEARVFDELARRCASLGWERAARAARLHLTSRLHAALLVPGSIRSGDRSATRALLGHAFQRARS